MARTWGEAVEAARVAPIPPHEVRFLVEHLAQRPLAFVRATALSTDDEERFEAGLQRLAAGEPLQYVLGEWSFFGLSLRVDSRVLIPRPETEAMVEAALRRIEGVPNPRVLDLGTGSGAIALAVKRLRPEARVLATDIDPNALVVARWNAENLRLPVEFSLGDWGDAVPKAWRGATDLVISNPPYVATGAEVEETVRAHEPAQALFSGPDGLDDLRILLERAPEWLSARGWIVLEHSPEQSELLQELAEERGYERVTLGRDLTGRTRWIMGQKCDDESASGSNGLAKG